MTKVYMDFSDDRSKTTFMNAEAGLCATVTQTAKGYVMCLMDTDADDGIVGTRIYKSHDEAICYAFDCVANENEKV